MKGGKRPLGYTIVEVMIVLAISGVMFLIAAQFIGGKQARTAFSSGVNEMASRLQDTIEQVIDGKYSDIPLKCGFSGPPAATVITPPGSTDTQGQNAPCVFLGKIMHFSVGGSQATYEVLSVAGGRVLDDSTPVTVLTGAKGADPQVVDALTIKQTTPQNLEICKVTINTASNRLGCDHPEGTLQSFAIGFFQSQGSLAGSSLDDGPQTISMYYVDGVASGTNSMTNNSPPLGKSPSPLLKATPHVDMCLTDGVRYADIILGANGNNQLSADVEMRGTTKC